MPPLRRLVVRFTYEIGAGRALDNARRESEEVERIYETIDALAARLAPQRDMQQVA
jgi:hypothetical protein